MSDPAEIIERIEALLVELKAALPSEGGRATDNRRPRATGARPRDPLWDVFVEVFGADAAGVERGRWNVAARSLRDAGATPEQLRAAAATYVKQWPEVAMTPMALAANWTILTGKGKSAEELERDRAAARYANVPIGGRPND